MSLKNRSRGYEFADYEYEFIFGRRNVGFVESISKDGRLFSLNPSPYFDADKNLHYYAEVCDPPPDGACVEVEVISEDSAYMQTSDGIKKDVLKKIGNWKNFDLNQIRHRNKLIEYDQIIDFFSQSFRGKEDVTKRIGTCVGLFAFSSPPISDVGGVNAAVLSKNVLWETFRKTMKIVPPDFFLMNSKYFYCISEKERTFPKTLSEEMNFAFLRPEKMMADIPIFLDDVSVKGNIGVIKQDIEDNRKFITAYLLDSLLIKPDPLKTVEKEVTNAVYEITEEYLRSGIAPYRQNLGDAIPTLSASISRLHLDPETKPKHVKEVLELWKEMHRKVKYRMGDSLPISKYYDLSDNTRKLYSELHNAHGKEYWIPMQEVLKITSLKHDIDFNFALNELVERGRALRDHRGVKLL